MRTKAYPPAFDGNQTIEMRYLILFLSTFLFAACAADVALEDEPIDNIFPVAEPAPAASGGDTLTAAPAEAAPTPYGMVIEAEEAEQQAKGITARSAAPALAAQKLLTGSWVNTTDSEEIVEFTPTHYKTYYDGEMLVEEDMTFHGNCPEACSGGTGTGAPCFTISGPAQTDCYGIVRLTEDVLELQVLGVSTETVVYRRAD